jgi:hypothetical protein
MNNMNTQNIGYKFIDTPFSRGKYSTSPLSSLSSFSGLLS